MDKLILADPSFAVENEKTNISAPSSTIPLSTDKPKRNKKRLKPEDLLKLDMDNIDEELAALNLDPYPVKKVEKKFQNEFALEMIRRRKLAEQMPEPLYDEDGLPILPDGSSRPFMLHELKQMSQIHQARLSAERPKPKPKKKKLRKNPPPRKVDIEALFREEIKRQEELRKYD